MGQTDSSVAVGASVTSYIPNDRVLDELLWFHVLRSYKFW
jgi:hypothetical protein